MVSRNLPFETIFLFSLFICLSIFNSSLFVFFFVLIKDHCAIFHYCYITIFFHLELGAQWLSGKVLDSRLRGRVFNGPHWRHCIVSLSNNINPSLVLVQSRKSCPFITERLLMDIKNQVKQKQTNPSKAKSLTLNGC